MSQNVVLVERKACCHVANAFLSRKFQVDDAALCVV